MSVRFSRVSRMQRGEAQPTQGLGVTGRDLERGAVHVHRLIETAGAVQALAESELNLYGAHAALRGVLVGSGHSGAAHISVRILNTGFNGADLAFCAKRIKRP
jgi:hypothetical protein